MSRFGAWLACLLIWVVLDFATVPDWRNTFTLTVGAACALFTHWYWSE